MLTLLFVAWIVCGLVCLADLIERRKDRKASSVATRITVTRRDAGLPLRIVEPPSNVVPLQKRWPA